MPRPARAVFDRARLVRLFVINRDIMIRTAALIAASASSPHRARAPATWCWPRTRCCTISMLIGAFFLDGFASAAEQLCGRAVGARDRAAFARAVQLSIVLGLRLRRRDDGRSILAGGPC